MYRCVEKKRVESMKDYAEKMLLDLAEREREKRMTVRLLNLDNFILHNFHRSSA